jgi:L-iditol 2-dehydrogenase
MDGSTGRRRPPIIMGHEAAGVIVRVGEAVRGWSPGDRVTFDSTVSCGVCWFCRRGEVNLCEDRRVLGVSCAEYRRHGAFAEYVAIPQRILYRLPDALDFRRAALVEALSVAVHAVGRAHVRIGDLAVVIGCGMIGLLTLQALRLAGCGRILAADVDPRRLELARKLGADEVLRADLVDVAAEALRHGGGRGADIAVDAVGLARSVAAAVGAVRKGGQLILIGNLAPKTELALQAVVTRELTLLGTCASSGEYPACLDLMASGRIQVDPLLSAVAPLADGASWFSRLHEGGEGLLKVVLEP